MRRAFLISAAALLLGLGPVPGHTASAVIPESAPVPHPGIALAQGWQGWWEREHEEDRARRGYWGLPPHELQRYNRLQAELNDLYRQRQQIDERVSRIERTQRRMLGLPPR